MEQSSVTRSSSTASAHRRMSRVVDLDYAAMARATQQRVAWPRLLSDPEWKWLENLRGFSLYAMEDNHNGAQGFRLLSTGAVKGSVPEIASLLAATSQDEYTHAMTALLEKEFKQGTFIADVSTRDNERMSTASTNASNSRLSIRTATFAGPGWVHRDEEWCYLDSTMYNSNEHAFEKLMVSLKLEEVVHAGDIRKAKLGKGKSIHNVICGFKILPDEHAEEDPTNPHNTSVRVHFFAEYAPPSTSSRGRGFGRFRAPKPDSALKVAQQRLLGIARSCERLPLLVRRRRLGVQVLMDTRRVLSLSNRQCIGCGRHQRLAKLCRVCGNAVCRDCSNKYERETCVPHTVDVRIERVRVCDPCMGRIEAGDFSNVTHRSVYGPTVFPDPVEDDYRSTQTTRGDLKSLLNDALLSAPSPQRKDAVISVIRSVLDQEDIPYGRPRNKSSVSTIGTEPDYITALDSLTLASTPYADAAIAGKQGRSYTLDPHNVSLYPIPPNEAERLQAIEDLGVLEKLEWAELDLICELAAKEVGAFASIVSILTKDEQRVVAANNPHFRTMHTNRENSFCTHTIMDNQPLIVPHPEADFRLSHIGRKWKLGVQFYCGFPLQADDGTVIGTLCCVDKQTHELTASQYTAMERLARTATRIIRMEAKKRRQTMAM